MSPAKREDVFKLLESLGVQQNVYKFYEECFANTEEDNSDDDDDEL